MVYLGPDLPQSKPQAAIWVDFYCFVHRPVVDDVVLMLSQLGHIPAEE